MPGIWPPTTRETRPWRQSVRGGTREDRMLREVEVRVPPRISQLPVRLESTVVADMEAALGEVVALDRRHGPLLDALGVLLIRTESVASSKIERVEARLDDYARALHGSRANLSAVSMVAATDALEAMVTRATAVTKIDLDMIVDAHAALMRGDLAERDFAGRFRTMQSWIGGSDHSPRNAIFVPPPPETVEDHMSDLIAFANRTDVPVLAQAAIAHAQFETIHPFTDGNGRIGRALVNTILRSRGVTRQVVIPLASALVAHRERYFADLDSYRDGSILPIVESFSRASRLAAAESQVTADRLEEIPERWRGLTGTVRAHSAAAGLLELLPRRPILSADEACAAVDAPASSVYAAIKRLHSAGVLRPLTERRRNQVWGAGLILDELDDLGTRIAAAAR